jgi:head-tail adaptor
MTISAGELKYRITIGLESNASDGQGGFVTTWASLGNAWAAASGAAKIGQSSVKNAFIHGQETHSERISFSIRQKQAFTLDTRLSDKYRISHRGQYFRVLGISQHQYDLDFYSITCELWGATTT